MFPVYGDRVCPVSQSRASSFLSLEAINIFEDFSGVSLKLNNSLCLIYFFSPSGGPRLEVCSPGSGSNVSLGVPLGVHPGIGSPLHPGDLQVGQHHCAKPWNYGFWELKDTEETSLFPEKSILGFRSKYYMKLWETSHISPTLQYISVWCFHLLTGFTGSLFFFDFIRDSMKLKINVHTRYSFGLIYDSHTFMNSSFSQFL